MGAERFNSNRVVTDLDAILQSPGFVRLHGKDHEINPILVGEFFAFANAIAHIKDMEKRDSISMTELVDAYYGMIFPVCPTITKDDILKCSQSQIAALMNVVNAHVTGGLTDEKKKAIMKNQAQAVN